MYKTLRLVALLIVLILPGRTLAQAPIILTEQEFDLEPRQAHVLCYRLAAGDRLQLNLIEESGKALQEVAIIAAGETRWRELETAVIEGVEVPVAQEGVYMLRVQHGRGGKRHVRLRLQRVPHSAETAYFETRANEVIDRDSVFVLEEAEVLVGTDTVMEQTTRRINSHTEFREDMILNRSERLTHGQENVVRFELPRNAETRARDEKVVGWAYWIGVGEESNLAWEQNKALINKSIKTVAGLALSPLGALVAGLTTDLMLPPKGIGEDVIYKLAQHAPHVEKGFLPVDEGAGVAAYRKINDPKFQYGEFGFFIQNDNLITPIDVEIRVSAYIEVKYWKEEYGNAPVARPRYETRTLKRFVGLLWE